MTKIAMVALGSALGVGLGLLYGWVAPGSTARTAHAAERGSAPPPTETSVPTGPLPELDPVRKEPSRTTPAPRGDAAPKPSLPAEAPARSARSLAGPVRAAPVFRDGNVAGVRVTGVRDGTLLSLLGIHSGDVIETIDGERLTTPARALEAYQRVVTGAADRLAIGVRRHGDLVTLHYRID